MLFDKNHVFPQTEVFFFFLEAIHIFQSLD
jgi:hypothetical protein